MTLAAYTGAFITPDQFYEKFNIPGDPYLTPDQIRDALGSEGVATIFQKELDLNSLFDNLVAGIPSIVPVKYSVLHEAGLTENTLLGPHFLVVVGMDVKYVYVHDPLFTDPQDGEAHAYPLDSFLKAWTDTTRILGYTVISQRSAIIPSAPIGAQAIKRIRVTIKRLNIRKGPGLNHAVVGTALLQEEYNILSEDRGWGEIAPGQWISLTYTETIPSVAPIPTPEPGDDDKDNGTPQQPGDGILFNIKLATSVPQNPTGTRAAEYLFDDPLIPSTHRNLCGDVSLSMIYETVTGKQNTLGYIYGGIKGTTRKPTGGSNGYQFAQQFANTFPSGWKAHSYFLSYVYYFEVGNPRHTKGSPGALSTSMTKKSADEIKDLIRKMLTDNTFVIAGATQSTRMEGAGATRLHPRGVGHWVVVTGVSDQYIYINNPFMNRREAYTWGEFMESFGYWILQIFPPSSYQPEVYTGPMESAHARLEQDRNKA